MSTLRLLAHIGKRTHYSVQRQLVVRKHNLACIAYDNWNRKTNASKYYDLDSSKGNKWLPLLNTKPQLFAAPIKIDCRRFIASKNTPDRANKTETKSSAAVTNHDDIFAESSNLGLFAKFKLMYKKYWYVLIPVHIVTSIGWFGGFYYLSQSGVDIAALLHQLHVSDNIIEKVKHSSMGHLAIAYLCYKIATPLRYAVTLGGTTLSIKYLVQSGHIKPLPSKQEIIKMYEQKKADRAAAKAEKKDSKDT